MKLKLLLSFFLVLLLSVNSFSQWNYLNPKFGYGTYVSVSFPEKNTGYIAGSKGRILKTTDAGETWQAKSSGTEQRLYTIAFRDSLHGYAGGIRGTFIETDDGGETWKQSNFITDKTIWNINFPSENTGYVVGTQGMIVKYTRDNSTDVKQEKNIAFDFSLEQNYPNPFNPNTAISYGLSAFSKVELKVYDVLGNEIATLVDENQNAGSYKVNFNGSNLSSGIYIYTLRAGNNFKSAKMILLK